MILMRLLIIGCGGHGRCCLEIAEAMNRYDEIAFLDDGHIGEMIQGRKVIGKINDIDKHMQDFDEVFIAIGNNHFRKELIDKVESHIYALATLIHPDARISKYSHIDKGTIIFPYACIESSARIGKGCIICSNTVINHDAIVQDDCLIYSNSTIRAEAVIEEETRIGSNCCISFQGHVFKQSDIKDGEVV